METTRKLNALLGWIDINGTEALIPSGQKVDDVRIDRYAAELRKAFRQDVVDPVDKLKLDAVGFKWVVPRGPRTTEFNRTRNAEIVRLHSEGVSLAKIAEQFEPLSRRRVHQIVRASGN